MSISSSAITWNAVPSSPFTFSNSSLTNNTISKGILADNGQVALTSIYASPTTISRVVTVFNQNKSFTTAAPPPPGAHFVQEIMTHEFGHWISLVDQYSFSCYSTTMNGTAGPGDSFRMSLATHDINGITWQYP